MWKYMVLSEDRRTCGGCDYLTLLRTDPDTGERVRTDTEQQNKIYYCMQPDFIIITQQPAPVRNSITMPLANPRRRACDYYKDFEVPF